MSNQTQFELNDVDVRKALAEGRALSASVTPETIGPEPSLEEIAALFYGASDGETLRSRAIARRGASSKELETFAPLYLTNTCDAECLMCGMRRDNDGLTRQTATLEEAFAQLEILRARGVLAVGLLTGEYRRGARDWAIGTTRAVLERAVELGFRHVLVNIGSLENEELDRLLGGLERREDGGVAPKVTMCTFQETYDRRVYGKFMGSNDDNPRADYGRRLANFDRAHDRGMRVVNPGVLLGLNPEIDFEMIALVMHVRHLESLGLEVYVSIPRLRKATGAEHVRGVTDDDFVRLVAILSIALPKAKLVITTRESSAVQRRVLPMVTVLSAGSSAVVPYTEEGANFPLDASQFEVIDQRPIEEILAEYQAEGVEFENFAPPS